MFKRVSSIQFNSFILYHSISTMYVKQCDCLKPCLWTTTFVDDRISLIHYTFFKTKCNFRSLKNYFIDKYIFLKILGLIQNIFNII
jgi:hypothetical protein